MFIQPINSSTNSIVRGCCNDTDGLNLNGDARMGDWRNVSKWGGKHLLLSPL